MVSGASENRGASVWPPDLITSLFTKKKVENAKELKIKIIDQNQFLKMLNKTS